MTSPEQLGERYLAVHHRMRRTVEDGMSSCGLTLTRTKVLAELQRRGATRPGMLAAEFGISPRTITDIADALERDGLVTRQPDPADRRAALLTVTGAGEAALKVAGATREQLLQRVFGALDPADRATMMRLLDTLDHAVASLLPADETQRR
jgi:DNA-binding MarR family transcriptional regulator